MKKPESWLLFFGSVLFLLIFGGTALIDAVQNPEFSSWIDAVKYLATIGMALLAFDSIIEKLGILD